MFGLDSLLVAVLGGLAQGIIGRARDMLRQRDDRRGFAERQQLLSTLRREEQKLQSEQRRAEREVQGMLAERQARRDHGRAVELVKFEALASLQQQRAAMREAQTPFQFDRAEVRRVLDEKLRAGPPVLLIAPFFDDARSGPQFDVALRRTWESLPWSDNLTSLAGLFRRPLQQADVDLMMIGDALQGRPAVLIHGDIQAGRRVWTSLLGFGLISGGPDDLLKVNLPKLHLPETAAGGDELLAFQDQLAELCGTVAGVFGDWYHLLRSGRAPQVHRQCRDDAVRRSLGAALAGAYDVAAAKGRLGQEEASLGQARVLAESGLGHAAAALAGAVPRAAIAGNRALRDGWAGIEELTGHDLHLPPSAPAGTARDPHRPSGGAAEAGSGDATGAGRDPHHPPAGAGRDPFQPPTGAAETDRKKAERAADFFLG
ncbi:hypothetical protein ACPPVO_30030 [Dactylosporangium sp. McL0621]|uniref:hypothetical protein n=1 Tax=Dactylosporangium sp. McL0621 TaxID=3415678 RepID=UPI003CFB1426